jgi:GDPmannose 4,6-dehydratase
MYLMMQQPEPEDFVIATGQTTSVRDFCRMAFRELGAELEFTGEGAEEKGIVAAVHNPEFALRPGQEVIVVDPRYFRPAEVDLLIGDATKAREKLGWTPAHSLQDLVQEMVRSDVGVFQQEKFLKEGGFNVKSRFE